MRPTLIVSHNGNTANNAYFNYRILESTGLVTNHGIRDTGAHAMSAPAWDALDFQIPRGGFVDDPIWTEVPGALAVNDRYILPLPVQKQTPLTSAVRRALDGNQFLNRYPRIARRLKAVLRTSWRVGNHAFSGIRSVGDSRIVHSHVRAPAADVLIHYGPAALWGNDPPSRVTVGLEHGTARWIRYGSDADRAARVEYLQRMSLLDHLWVTNLDDRTLEVVDEVLEHRWSALPHPYFLDENSPYEEDPLASRRLREQLASDFLIFMPSSINWLPDHDKGTRSALNAFISMRRSGLSVGLILVNWGRQLAEARSLLAAAHVQSHVAWIEPQPRIPMQRLMACVDVVWDQFHYGTFGGVAMKAMEQGVPLITHSVDSRGARLMGGGPPYMDADNDHELLVQCTKLYDSTSSYGRPAMAEEWGAPLRHWMRRNHHHHLTAELQVARYRELLSSPTDRERASPDAWAKLLAGPPISPASTASC